MLTVHPVAFRHACSKAEAQGGLPGVLMTGWVGGNASVPVKRMGRRRRGWMRRMDGKDGRRTGSSQILHVLLAEQQDLQEE